MALKYRLISCDFDDTLTRPDDTISDYTRSAVAEYVRRGGVFMLNTGRMYGEIRNRVAETGLGLTDAAPISSCQGAMIREYPTDNTLYYRPLRFEDCLAVAREAERRGIYIQAYHNDTLIIAGIYGEESFGSEYARIAGLNNFHRAPSFLSEYIEKHRAECTKLLMVSVPEKAKERLEFFKGKFPSLIFNTSRPYMLEVIHNESGKDKACDFMCGRLGISIDECMAFGDSMNDFSMIKRAGFSVAVGNALPEVKDEADYVTAPNTEDGVAKAIEKFCL